MQTQTACGRGRAATQHQRIGDIFNVKKVGGMAAHMETSSGSRSRSASVSSGASGDLDNELGCDFCNRPEQNIICRACGHTFVGRARVRCGLHPALIHLMDFQCCPNCMSSQLREFGIASPEQIIRKRRESRQSTDTDHSDWGSARRGSLGFEPADTLNEELNNNTKIM